MPFALIPTALGVCFCLVWVFIGGMVFRDGQLAAQRERESEFDILPMPERRIAARKSAAIVQAKNPGRGALIRAAS